jgi:hypothetical protein
MNGQNESAFSNLTAFWAELSWSDSRIVIGSIRPSSAPAAPSPAPIDPVTSVTIWSRFRTTAPFVA